MTDEVVNRPVVIRHVVPRMVSTLEPAPVVPAAPEPASLEPVEGSPDLLLPPTPSQLAPPLTNNAPTAPPPLLMPAEDKLPEPSNEHDSLLAAFLAGATIPPAPDSTPPKDPDDEK
jgi:hypothetical protein